MRDTSWDDLLGRVGVGSRIVCLIGSSKFKSKFHSVGELLEKNGHLVLMMSFFQHADAVYVSDEHRSVLEFVDRWRIRLSDVVVVINDWDGSRYYIGDSTRKEIKYALSINKSLHYLYPIPVGNNAD
jgi:hypothetical protein